MLASILTQLGINDTLWIQLGIFIALFIILKIFYFGPFLKLIELRERESSGVEKEADDLVKRAEQSEQEYQVKLSAVKKQARETHDQLVTKAKNEAGTKVNKARALNKEKIETARKEIMEEAQTALNQAKGDVDKISDLFVEKLMRAKADL